MTSRHSRCLHCCILNETRPHKKCRICQDQALMESFLCGMHARQEGKSSFVCHAFQPILSLVGNRRQAGDKKINVIGKEKSFYFSKAADTIINGKCSRNGVCGKCSGRDQHRKKTSSFHVVWNVRQRMPLFIDSERYLSFLHDAFLTCGTLLTGRAVLLWLAPDHLHFYLEIPDEMAVGEIIEDLQGLTHDALLNVFAEIREKIDDGSFLWEASYFLESIDQHAEKES